MAVAIRFDVGPWMRFISFRRAPGARRKPLLNLFSTDGKIAAGQSPGKLTG
jgi:hypothetical protein